MKKFWIIKVALMIAVAAFAFTYITMYLWNWLVPLLFHGPVIGFCEALGLLVLSKILFGRFGGHGGCGGRCGSGRWRGRWQQKWDAMTPEQREELKKKWDSRCGNRWFDSGEEEKKPANG